METVSYCLSQGHPRVFHKKINRSLRYVEILQRIQSKIKYKFSFNFTIEELSNPRGLRNLRILFPIPKMYL